MSDDLELTPEFFEGNGFTKDAPCGFYDTIDYIKGDDEYCISIKYPKFMSGVLQVNKLNGYSVTMLFSYKVYLSQLKKMLELCELEYLFNDFKQI